jgi:hypothetical protein
MCSSRLIVIQVNSLKNNIQQKKEINIPVLCTCGYIFHIHLYKDYAVLPL